MTELRPTSAQDDLRATLADAGRVGPEVERLRAELTEAHAMVAAAYEAAARVCDDKAGDALIAAQEAQDRHDLRECVLLEDRAAALMDAGASIRALASAAARATIRAETKGK